MSNFSNLRVLAPGDANVSPGEEVKPAGDGRGRTVTYPYTIRDLTQTARVAITTTGENTLLAGAASTFHDLLWLLASNESSNAVSLIIRDATGGGVVQDIELGANETRPIPFPTPWPQNVAADEWTAEVEEFVNDGTTDNGTVNVNALFIPNNA